MTAQAIFGQSGAEQSVWAQLRDCMGQMQRASGRDAWLADLRCVPKALRWALPWLVLGRTSRDANPCRWLTRQARRRRNAIAVSDPSRSLTFEALRRETFESAAALQRRGITANDRVAILLPTGVDLVVTLLGCWQLGAIPCPLDPTAPAAILDQVRSQLGAAFEIRDYAPLLPEADRSHRVPHHPIHAADVAMILPTSGSEGHIKLCRITAGRLALSGNAFGGVALGCRRGDVIYCPLPLCHATGITVALMPALVHGVTLHLPGKFSASKLLQELRDTNATQLIYVGDLLRMAVAALGSDANTAPRASAPVLDAEDRSNNVARSRASMTILDAEDGSNNVARSRASTTILDAEDGANNGARSRASTTILDAEDGANSGALVGSATEGRPRASTSCSLQHGPEAPTSHRLRVAVGNGLDQRTYQRAASALQIPRIVEFYGATEAPRVLLNLSNRPGSCGRVPFRRLSRFLVVKEGVRCAQDECRVSDQAERGADADRSDRDGEPCKERVARERETGPIAAAAGSRGWTLCKPGEVGELWIRIPSRRRPWLGDFEGYLERDHEERVVLRDVFRPGDRFYRTYDLVRYDADDYFYFVERLGKVWRNRGHNVSTTWLTEELRLVSAAKDVSVFPVALDESPRRFGLALVVTDDHERLRDALTQKIRSLPNYARPQLIQVVPAIPRTLSFKPISALQSNGAAWEPNGEMSALYLWDDGLRAVELPEWANTKRRLLTH